MTSSGFSAPWDSPLSASPEVTSSCGGFLPKATGNLSRSRGIRSLIRVLCGQSTGRPWPTYPTTFCAHTSMQNRRATMQNSRTTGRLSPEDEYGSHFPPDHRRSRNLQQNKDSCKNVIPSMISASLRARKTGVLKRCMGSDWLRGSARPARNGAGYEQSRNVDQNKAGCKNVIVPSMNCARRRGAMRVSIRKGRSIR